LRAQSLSHDFLPEESEMKSMIATTAVTAGLILSATAAQAAGVVEVTKLRVQFADLNLNTPHGAHELYARLSGAADIACGDQAELADISEMRAIAACRQKAIEDAVARINRPRLTAVYDEHYRKEALVG
jgi:UrcA family protein